MYALSLKRTHPCPYHPLPPCQGMVTFFSLFLRVLPPIFNEHYIYCKVGDDVPVYSTVYSDHVNNASVPHPNAGPQIAYITLQPGYL